MPASDAQGRARNEDAATAGEGSASRDRSRSIGDFRIARGGPYYDLQQQLGLLREGALHAGRRAVILVGLAGGVLLVLSAIAGQAIGPVATRPFLLDLGAWARFFIAVGIFVLMERLVEERLRVHLRHFVRASLLAPGDARGRRDGGASAAAARSMAGRAGVRGCSLCHHA